MCLTLHQFSALTVIALIGASSLAAAQSDASEDSSTTTHTVRVEDPTCPSGNRNYIVTRVNGREVSRRRGPCAS